MNTKSQGSNPASLPPKSPEQAAKDARALMSSALISAAITTVALWSAVALLG